MTQGELHPTGESMQGRSLPYIYIYIYKGPSSAGATMLPSVSVPIATGANPAATAAADPLDEPSALRSSTCGFFTSPPAAECGSFFS